jgi:hypothetical protein
MRKCSSISLLALIMVVPLVSFAETWVTEVVDPESGCGKSSSLVIDTNDNVHIAYTAGDDCRYAVFDGSTWDIQTATAGSVDFRISLAVEPVVDSDSLGTPHISVLKSGLDWYALYYYYFNGSSWTWNLVDNYDGGLYNSIELNSENHPRISHLSWWDQDLLYAYHDGSQWQSVTVDTEGWAGFYSSLALESGPEEYPHIAYRREPADDLMHAHQTSSGWVVAPVDTAGDVGRYSSLDLDSNDCPHISYQDANIFGLKYARWTGSDWDITVVDDTGSTGSRSQMVLDSQGRPHIVYFQDESHKLRYARWDGSVWNLETIAIGIVSVSSQYSIDLDSADQPHISYYDGCLMYAHPETAGIAGNTLDSGLTIAVHPNPSSGTVTVHCDLESASPLELSVFDVSGRLIEGFDLGPAFGSSVVVGGLNTGVYIVHAVADGHAQTARFLVIE